MQRFLLAAVLLCGITSASAQMLQTIVGGNSTVPAVFDTYPALAPQAYCGVIKMRSAYAGNALQLALGSSLSTTLDVGWVTTPTGVQVADSAAVQTWLAANGNGWAWVKKCYDQSGNGFDYTVDTVGTNIALFIKEY